LRIGQLGTRVVVLLLKRARKGDELEQNPAQDSVPTSSNPTDYAYAVQVDDDEVLSLRTQMDEKLRLSRRLRIQLEIAQAEQTALKERLFLRLEDLYPGMSSLDLQGGVGLREWQNNLWYVAWDSQHSG
jgi:hypothetical protein